MPHPKYPHMLLAELDFSIQNGGIRISGGRAVPLGSCLVSQTWKPLYNEAWTMHWTQIHGVCGGQQDNLYAGSHKLQ